MQKYLSDKNETNLRLPGPVPVPFDILNEQTKPLINYYSEIGKLEKVKTIGDPSQVFAEIKNILNKYIF